MRQKKHMAMNEKRCTLPWGYNSPWYWGHSHLTGIHGDLIIWIIITDIITFDIRIIMAIITAIQCITTVITVEVAISLPLFKTTR
jgi:hypothetical protein